jgi:hypothetical protein
MALTCGNRKATPTATLETHSYSCRSGLRLRRVVEKEKPRGVQPHGVLLGRGGDRDSLYLATTNRLMGAAVNARPEPYDGIVWFPHLRTGILLARCNGRTFWTGMSTSATR